MTASYDLRQLNVDLELDGAYACAIAKVLAFNGYVPAYISFVTA